MRTQALSLAVAAGAVVVTASAVVAAFVVDDSSSPDTPAGPTVSVTPSVTQMTPVPTATTTAPATAPPATTPPTTPSARPTAAPTRAPAPRPRTLRYVVKPGDTLSDIAAWFRLNGYRGLYEANRSVIGSDPDRIRPGQVYTIKDGRLRMG